MKNPKKPKKDITIAVRIPLPLHNRYAEAAERLQISKAALVEKAVTAFIELAEQNDYQIPWPPRVKLTHKVVPGDDESDK